MCVGTSFTLSALTTASCCLQPLPFSKGIFASLDSLLTIAFPSLLLTEEERARLPNAPAYKDKTVMQDSAYWAANGAKLIERFNKWLVT